MLAKDLLDVALAINFPKIKDQYDTIIETIKDAASKGEFCVRVKVKGSKNSVALVEQFISEGFKCCAEVKTISTASSSATVIDLLEITWGNGMIVSDNV